VLAILPIMLVATWLVGVYHLDLIEQLAVCMGVGAFGAVVMVLSTYLLEW
jgi:hypothetical protein